MNTDHNNTPRIPAPKIRYHAKQSLKRSTHPGRIVRWIAIAGSVAAVVVLLLLIEFDTQLQPPHSTQQIAQPLPKQDTVLETQSPDIELKIVQATAPAIAQADTHSTTKKIVQSRKNFNPVALQATNQVISQVEVAFNEPQIIAVAMLEVEPIIEYHQNQDSIPEPLIITPRVILKDEFIDKLNRVPRALLALKESYVRPFRKQINR